MKFFTWSLRKVWRELDSEVEEVLFDEEGKPALTSPASLFDKIRYVGDWLFKEPLVWPDDFDGQIRLDGAGHIFAKV